MAINKPSDKVLRSLLRRRERMQESIREARVIASGAKNEFWKAMQSRILSKLAKVKSELREYQAAIKGEANPLITLTALLEAQRQQEYFYTSADDFAEGLGSMEMQLAKLNDEIKNYSEKLNKFKS